MAFRCTGRGYPNCPATAKIGCLGRPGPYVFQVRWEFGDSPLWTALNGQWNDCVWSQTHGFGLNPTNSWVFNLSISNRVTFQIAAGPGIQQFQVLISCVSSGGPFLRVGNFREAPRPGFFWEFLQHGTFTIPLVGAVGPPPIADDFLRWRVGHYDQIAANSCL